MADAQKSCMICGDEESAGGLLVAAPCGRHFVCPDDVSSFFERATENESLFPPKCCGQIFLLEQFEEHVPFEVSWAYQAKEQGEFATLAKFRVYCGAPGCNKFLNPASHITDPATNLTYAICEEDGCGKTTCTGCKTLLDQGVQNHNCTKDEDELKFKQIAKEKGYQECSVCGATVELMEACNHISCDCGHDFCYVCGKDWPGVHGCPHYGPATYDEEGYNQDGYHRDTGLNREGLTRREENMRLRGDEEDDRGDEEVEDPDDDGEDDPDWEVLQHLDQEQRDMVNMLGGMERLDALDQLRIQLFEQRGILFGQNPPPPPPPPPQEQEDEEGAGDQDGEPEEGAGDFDDQEFDEEEEPDIMIEEDEDEEPQLDDLDLADEPVLEDEDIANATPSDAPAPAPANGSNNQMLANAAPPHWAYDDLDHILEQVHVNEAGDRTPDKVHTLTPNNAHAPAPANHSEE